VLRAAVVAVAASGLALAGQVGSAWADPKVEEAPIELVCGTTTYHVVTKGNGDWVAAHDVDSTLVFVPHAFTEFRGELRDEQGNLLDSFVEEGYVKGSGKQKNDQTCTYSFSEVSDGSDPEFPAGYTFTGGGGVVVQITGGAR
jgi:hypothetical protein